MPDQLQQPLFHEDFNAALRHLISALGGPKKVGDELWPSMKNPEKAGRKLSDCLNDSHQQKLGIDDLVWLLSEGRKKGIHCAMAYLNEDCGYAPPQPLEPEDERARLQREYIAATKAMGDIAKRMERLSLPHIQAVT